MRFLKENVMIQVVFEAGGRKGRMWEKQFEKQFAGLPPDLIHRSL